MKLDEVAAPAEKKFALVIYAHGRSIDNDDWQGSTSVYFNRKEFEKTIIREFAEFANLVDDEDVDVKKLKYSDIENHDSWESFIENIWIDNRF